MLFTVTYTALPCDLYFFNSRNLLHIPSNSHNLLRISTVQLLERRKAENLTENHTPVSYGLRNPYRPLKSENSQDYDQKPQGNCTFMNSASWSKLKKGVDGHLWRRCMIVVFPLPDSPTRATLSPGLMFILTPSSTRTVLLKESFFRQCMP